MYVIFQSVDCDYIFLSKRILNILIRNLNETTYDLQNLTAVFGESLMFAKRKD